MERENRRSKKAILRCKARKLNRIRKIFGRFPHTAQDYKGWRPSTNPLYVYYPLEYKSFRGDTGILFLKKQISAK